MMDEQSELERGERYEFFAKALCLLLQWPLNFGIICG